MSPWRRQRSKPLRVDIAVGAGNSSCGETRQHRICRQGTKPPENSDSWRQANEYRTVAWISSSIFSIPHPTPSLSLSSLPRLHPNPLLNTSTSPTQSYGRVGGQKMSGQCSLSNLLEHNISTEGHKGGCKTPMLVACSIQMSGNPGSFLIVHLFIILKSPFVFLTFTFWFSSQFSFILWFIFLPPHPSLPNQIFTSGSLFLCCFCLFVLFFLLDIFPDHLSNSCYIDSLEIGVIRMI